MNTRRFLSSLTTIALLLLLFTAAPARAGDGPALSWTSLSWSETIVDQGGRHQAFGGRLAFNLGGLPFGLHAVVRADASAIQDGGSVEWSDPSTFNSLELYGGLYRNLWRGVGLAGIYGIAMDIDRGKVVVMERYPQTYAGCLRAGDVGGSWLYACAGRHEAAGDGLKGLFAAQLRVKDRVSFVADGVVGPGWFVRAGPAVRLR